MTTRREFLQWLVSATLVTSTGIASALPLRLFRDSKNRILGEITIAVADYPELQTVFGSVILEIDGLPSADQCAGQSKIVVTRLSNDQFAAVSARCTHAGCCVSPYDAQQGFINCSCHGSRFTAEGQVIQGPASAPLKRYATNFDGTLLTITIPGLVNVPDADFPTTTAILNVTPNPNRGTVTVHFSLARPERIELSIFSIDGRQVHRLLRSEFNSGLHTVPLQFALPPGTYFLRLNTASGTVQDVAITVQP